MVDYSGSFNEHAEILRERRKEEDHIDYYAAMSKQPIGRQPKYLPRDEVDPLTGEKKDAIAEALQRTLEDLLLNQQYRIDHGNLVNAVREASTRADDVLDKINAQLGEAMNARDIMLSKAARLEDGRVVFKFSDGRVEDENGNIIDEELTAHIIWTDDMPTGEDFRNIQDRIEQLEAAKREALGIKSELRDINDRAHDNENPFQPDALKPQTDRANDLKDRLEGIRSNVLENNSKHTQSELTQEQGAIDVAPATSATLPKIKIGG